MNEQEKNLVLAAGGHKKRKIKRPNKLVEARDQQIQETLDGLGGHVVKAAKKLGIHRSTIYRWRQRQKLAQNRLQNATLDCKGRS